MTSLFHTKSGTVVEQMIGELELNESSNKVFIVLLTPTLSAKLLRSHLTLKSILQEILFLDQLHDFWLPSINSFLQPFLKSKIM